MAGLVRVQVSPGGSTVTVLVALPATPWLSVAMTMSMVGASPRLSSSFCWLSAAVGFPSFAVKLSSGTSRIGGGEATSRDHCQGGAVSVPTNTPLVKSCTVAIAALVAGITVAVTTKLVATMPPLGGVKLETTGPASGNGATSIPYLDSR